MTIRSSLKLDLIKAMAKKRSHKRHSHHDHNHWMGVVLVLYGSPRDRQTADGRSMHHDEKLWLTTVTSLMGALCRSKRRAQSTWSPWMAMWRGLSPFFVFVATGEPLSSSRSTTCSWPLLAAQWSGVNPSCSTVEPIFQIILSFDYPLIGASSAQRATQCKSWRL